MSKYYHARNGRIYLYLIFTNSVIFLQIVKLNHDTDNDPSRTFGNLTALASHRRITRGSRMA
jgi:hypothetical protein